MTYLLDTNICIYLIRQRPPAVLERFRSLQVGQVAISAITLSELHFGVQKSQRPEQNGLALAQFTAPLVVLPFTEEAAETYGALRATLERAGTPIGPLDTLIAAHALHLGHILVTNNVSEFARVPGLRVENWAEPPH